MKDLFFILTDKIYTHEDVVFEKVDKVTYLYITVVDKKFVSYLVVAAKKM